jgi:hypothetical protein
LSLIDAPEEKLIDCRGDGSAQCDGARDLWWAFLCAAIAISIADAQDRVRVTR